MLPRLHTTPGTPAMLPLLVHLWDAQLEPPWQHLSRDEMLEGSWLPPPGPSPPSAPSSISKVYSALEVVRKQLAARGGGDEEETKGLMSWGEEYSSSSNRAGTRGKKMARRINHIVWQEYDARLTDFGTRNLAKQEVGIFQHKKSGYLPTHPPIHPSTHPPAHPPTYPLTL